ncbi:MAG: glycosyltransferase family 4 protein [Terriglobia bacterium]
MARNGFGGRRLRLCKIVTVPLTFTWFLRKQIDRILEAGIDVALVSSPGRDLDELCSSLPVRCFRIPMERKTAPMHDLRALLALTRYFRRERFDIVHSHTPKAGLLTALAGRLAHVPVRIHTYTGQVWVELHGLMRWMTRESDKLIGHLNTHCYADSYSQRNFLVDERIVDAQRISVLGRGSVSGVDLDRFNTSLPSWRRAETRKRLGIEETSLVIIFVGRVTRDKGVTELIEAFRKLQQLHNNIDLVLVGPYESIRDTLPDETLREISANTRIHSVGLASRPEEYLAIADIFCLPSYREGFGSAIIEAGAMNLPSVATRVTGLVDSVVDDETGILVPPKDAMALARALKEIIESADLRQRMGRAARQWVVQHFDAEVINRAVVDEYFRLAGNN